jgi:hypothetical protein
VSAGANSKVGSVMRFPGPSRRPIMTPETLSSPEVSGEEATAAESAAASAARESDEPEQAPARVASSAVSARER